MLIVVLVLIWIVALAPTCYRRLSERHASTSVDRFHYRTWLFRRAYPTIGAVQVVAPAMNAAERREDLETQLRLERRRIRLRRERRRRVLIALGGGVAASLMLGALPRLHVMWDLTIALTILTAAYVAMLTSIARNEALSLERLRKVIPLGTEHERPERAHLAMAAGDRRSPLSVAPMRQRPAFVLVEAPYS